MQLVLPSRTCRRRLRRQAVLVLLLVSQLLSTTGLPMPVVAAAPAKDRSVPFPCMNRGCGCMNAAQCWQQCCCFSHREHVAWATEHGVPVPADAGQGDTTKPCNSCCQDSKPAPDCPHCEQQPKEPAPDCSHCRQKPKESADTSSDEEQTETLLWVIGMMASRCQGHGPQRWLAEAPLTLPAPSLTPWLALEYLATIQHADTYLDSARHLPPTPPPRTR